MWLVTMSRHLRAEFNPQGLKIHAEEFNYCTMKMLTIFNSDIKPLLKMWGVEKNIDNTKSKEDLGIKYRPAK